MDGMEVRYMVMEDFDPVTMVGTTLPEPYTQLTSLSDVYLHSYHQVPVGSRRPLFVPRILISSQAGSSTRRR